MFGPARGTPVRPLTDDFTGFTMSKTARRRRRDNFARDQLQQYAASQGDGPAFIQINQRLSLPQGGYRVPDVYFPQDGTIFDGTIGTKTATTPQIVDYGIANGGAPIYIVRPPSYGGTYLIGP